SCSNCERISPNEFSPAGATSTSSGSTKFWGLVMKLRVYNYCVTFPSAPVSRPVFLNVYHGCLGQYIRPQDLIVWVLLFAAVAILGPDRSSGSIALLCALGVFQIIEQRVQAIPHGGVISYVVKLALCCMLIGWTDGIASRYFWML